MGSRWWILTLLGFSASVYSLGFQGGPYPLHFQKGDRSDCINLLAETVIRRRFDGETAYVNFGSPGEMRAGEGLEEFLRAARVPEAYVLRIATLMAQLMASDLENDPLLREPVSVLQNGSARRGLTLCLLSGNCRGQHDGLYVSPQRDFELASLKHPEYAESEDREYRICLDADVPTYPPLLVASTQGLIPTADAAEEDARALRWVGMLFHELKHHTNRELVSRWIQANLWFLAQSKPTDRLFQKYVDIGGAVPRVDRGFLTIFEESTAHNAAFRVIAVSLEQGGSERTRSALVQASHARFKIDQIRQGAYGPSAARAIDEGLELADHMGPINDQNFLLVGAIIQQQMNSTIDRSEREQGATPPVHVPLQNPTYSITTLNAPPEGKKSSIIESPNSLEAP